MIPVRRRYVTGSCEGQNYTASHGSRSAQSIVGANRRDAGDAKVVDTLGSPGASEIEGEGSTGA